jgi:hypothetical protein
VRGLVNRVVSGGSGSEASSSLGLGAKTLDCTVEEAVSLARNHAQIVCYRENDFQTQIFVYSTQQRPLHQSIRTTNRTHNQSIRTTNRSRYSSGLVSKLIGMAVLGFYHPWLLGFDVFLLAAIAVIIFVLGRGAVESERIEAQVHHGRAA